jgi:hypothetical protein
MAQGEGSGLIDIRALASATQAVADRPYASNRDKVEDLLAVGSTGTTFSATSLAAPVAVDKPDHSRTMLYGMAAAILLLGGAVTYLVVRPDPQPIAAIAPVQDTAPAPAAQAAKEAPAEAPQAAEPTPPPSEATAAGEADDGDKAKDDGDKSERSHRHHGDKSEKADKPEKAKSEPVAAAEPTPPPKKSAASSGDKSLDDLLDTALGGKPKPAAKAAPATAPSDNLPATPSRDDVLSAMKGIAPDVASCGKGESGVAMAKVGVTGASGKVSSVDVSGSFAGSPVGSCVAKEVRKAKFPKFSQSTFSFSYPFKI